MKLLLDTQIALWAVLDHPKLSSRAAALIRDRDNQLWVSVISIWEIAIKYPLQRGDPDDIPFPGADAWTLFERSGFAILPVTAAHAAAIDDLPPIHADPFDRMLVAQARSGPMYLLTSDARLGEYGEFVRVV